jgi:hypothetical protein
MVRIISCRFSWRVLAGVPGLPGGVRPSSALFVLAMIDALMP